MASKARALPKLDALPDTVDFRDTLYIPTLVAVKAISDIQKFLNFKVPILNQGREGACTGYGLATVANYLIRARDGSESADKVSAWMLYTMAKRYDEWPGDDYEGSSARGAIKGWHKHGLCGVELWKDKARDNTLNEDRAADALKRPLGAYFRVNHKDLVAMHAAISEIGVLFATARVHTGWQELKEGEEEIVFKDEMIGGHAFAIVGYDRDGFWIQNSWGSDWGQGGLARLSYADWLENGTDVWVAALGAPVSIKHHLGSAEMMVNAPRCYESHIYATLRPYIITCKNDGVLDDKGAYGLTSVGLRRILTETLPQRVEPWAKKRVVIYAHGGLVLEEAAVETVANYREKLLNAEVYPLSIIWRSDAWTTFRNILKEALAGRRDEGMLDDTKDFLLDRLDDTLEPLARVLGGKALWDEMKENATGTVSNRNGGARQAADHLVKLYEAKVIDEIHLVGHSAGSVLHAALAQYLIKKGVRVRSLSLWAPACTLELFNTTFKPLIDSGDIESFDLYTLNDATEQNDNCANIYHKSLLYLVSAAFEAIPRIPGIIGSRDGVPLLGLEKDVEKAIPKSFWNVKSRNWMKAPVPESQALHHGDFDDDEATLKSTLGRITTSATSTGTAVPASQAMLTNSAVAQRRFRQKLDQTLSR